MGRPGDGSARASGTVEGREPGVTPAPTTGGGPAAGTEAGNRSSPPGNTAEDGGGEGSGSTGATEPSGETDEVTATDEATDTAAPSATGDTAQSEAAPAHTEAGNATPRGAGAPDTTAPPEDAEASETAEAPGNGITEAAEATESSETGEVEEVPASGEPTDTAKPSETGEGDATPATSEAAKTVEPSGATTAPPAAGTPETPGTAPAGPATGAHPADGHRGAHAHPAPHHAGFAAAPPTGSTDPGPEPRPDRYSHTWSATYGVLSAVLLFTALFRDAGWVLFWTLGASFFFASMAFAARNPASRRGAVGVLTGSLALFRNLPSTPRFLTAPLRGARSRHLVGPVVLTVVVTGALLLVFGLLFATADAVFLSYLDDTLSHLFPDDIGLTLFGNLFAMAAAVLLTGAAVLTARRRHAPRRVPRPAPASSRPNSLPVWVLTIPLVALIALFSAFLAVQAVAMFGGDDYVQRVAGVTYAQYARQGFFQLLVVSVLVLCVIGLVVRVLPSRTTRVLRNALLGALCVLTLVILASAMMRLQLYIDAFGLSRLRATAEAWIVWSAGLFGLVLVAGACNTLGRSAAWLPRVTAAFAGVALAVFAYGNPDLRIAESQRNLEVNAIDTLYLRGLSADAVPALMELEEEKRDCVLVGFQDLVETSDDFASWNLSRHQARQRLTELSLFEVGGQAGLDCSYRDAFHH
ncbi:DUF4153 domain-containing protein [Nocardiopsis halotolerans]